MSVSKMGREMLDQIPAELLTSILGHTTKADKLNTSLVCRRVQSVICSTRSLKKRPDEIRISTRLINQINFPLGRIRMDKQKIDYGKRRMLVTLRRNQDAKGRAETTDTMDADELDDSSPSTSSDLPQLEEILAQCIHSSVLTLSAITINCALLDLLSSSSTELNRVTTVTLDLCVFADQEELFQKLRAFLSKTSVQYLTIEFCREEGKRRIICDELFDSLPHLQRIDMQEREPGTNAITKKLVDKWIASSSPPYLINFRNCETTISLDSVMRMIQFTIRTRRQFKTVWNLGTLRGSSKGELASLLLLPVPDLSIMQHIDMFGQRHFKISHPFLELKFSTIGC